MAYEDFEKVAEDFLNNPLPEVLAIKGGWGVGKTFFWRKFTESHPNELYKNFENYSYVSLFGMDSIEDLKFGIFQGITNLKSGIEPTRFKKSRSNLCEKTKNIGTFCKIKFHGNQQSTWRKLASNIPKIPQIKGYGPLIQSLTFSTIHKMVICFDDLERAGDNLSLRGILGLASVLKEERDCKVILIFNQSELKNIKDFDLYKEKVIDTKVDFNLTAEEAANIVFKSSNKIDAQLKKYSILLDIKNIRILQKIKKYSQYSIPDFSSHNELLISKISKSLVLFCWSYEDADDSVPDIQFLKNLENLYHSYFSRKGEIDDTKKKWISILNKIGYFKTDPLDYAIANLVEKGFSDSEDFQRQIELVSAQNAANQSEASLRKIWDMIFQGFDNNEGEILNAIKQVFQENSKYYPANSLNQILLFLRELKKDDFASQLLDNYIKDNSEDQDRFNIDKNYFSNEIVDVELKEKFSKKYLEFQDNTSIEKILMKISKSKSWSQNEIEILSLAKTEDFFRIFKTANIDNVYEIIEICLKIGSHIFQKSHDKSMSTNVINALKQIIDGNLLNKFRIKRFNITDFD